MAKALLGHVGGTAGVLTGADVRTASVLAANRRLTGRVRELEAQVDALRAEVEALASAVDHDDLLRLASAPALA